MAQRAAPSSPMAADTRIISEECDRLAARLTQFILFAKPFTLHLSEVDPDTVIEEVTLLLEPDCQSKNVRWVHQRATQPITVMADRELLRQAVFNLLHNAVKYTRSDSEVTIMTRNDGPHVIIEILDQGPGVEPDDVPKLFMPYFSTDPGGTGLGLSLVRKIAIAHGWDVTFSPAPGGGSAFRLLIPRNGQKRVGK
jgi:two-component system sensor histidine kinase FlrB